jgi:hypothetical protein
MIVEETGLREKVKVAQQKDLELEKQIRENPRYQVIEGIIYWNHNKESNGKEEWKLVIPKELRRSLMEENHDSLMGSHLGLKRTYARMTQDYYWPGMYKDVRAWILDCDHCTTKKSFPDKKMGLMKSISTNRPFQIVGTDILGPLPASNSGNRYILTFTDHFTKWVEGYAIPEASAKQIAQHFVKEIVFRHGCPERLLSDRGPAFIGELMTEITHELEIHALKTSAFHPQTNGQTERFNRTLMNMLAMYTEAHQKDWDTYLPYVLHAYRTSVHTSTGETPYFLMYGRDAKMPSWLDILRIEKGEQDIGQYKQEMLANIEKVFQEVRYYGNIIRHKRENENRKRNHEHPFKIGDLVWLYAPRRVKGLSQKLRKPWIGPF